MTPHPIKTISTSISAQLTLLSSASENGTTSERRSDPLLQKLHDFIAEITELREQQDELPKNMRASINTGIEKIIAACEKTVDSTWREAGKFLHHIDDKKHSPVKIQKTIDLFPEALLLKNGKGEVPIQRAVRCAQSVGFIKILAEGSIKSCTDTAMERGGLSLNVMSSYPRLNILQWLVNSYDDDDDGIYNTRCLLALKDLRQCGLLSDDDITSSGLINQATSPYTLKRLEYLLGEYPVALSTRSENGNLMIHDTIHHKNIRIFLTALKVGIRFHRRHFGFLFDKNKSGKMALTMAIEKYGKDKALHVVQKCIPPSCTEREKIPILHQVLRKAPTLIDDFVRRYPDALFMLDRKGRHLIHAALENGIKKSPLLLLMIQGNEESLEERDPATGLYPFMLSDDLSTIHDLLRRRPEACLKHLPQEKQSRKGIRGVGLSDQVRTSLERKEEDSQLREEMTLYYLR
eukprot:CAMPEP_0194082962 /NCGR_PEP_ID=MMETSP0149-20130528/8340_1 /TAXON_ID=122233 /ORGANISM="Chaetoceros debilis, Strain MM31A-1" /LENGTH=462 /DNA_ID=CAMNT_0038765245 /DNA_START=6 /DNA_END=1394 /DNA_ORIENTATION=+